MTGVLGYSTDAIRRALVRIMRRRQFPNISVFCTLVRVTKSQHSSIKPTAHAIDRNGGRLGTRTPDLLGVNQTL